MNVLGRLAPKVRNADSVPTALLSATASGLCAAPVSLLRPPTSRALTPLLEMNSTAPGWISLTVLRSMAAKVPSVVAAEPDHSLLPSAM